MSVVHVAGTGLWVGASPPPPAAILPPALRRRAGVLCRAVAEAVARALAEGGADPSRTPIVYGSVYGETTAAVEMMGAFATGEGLPSPTTFHNSVHNAPAGYLSIATGCHAFSSSIAAGPETAAMALLDAFLLLGQRGGDVVVALADEPVPPPLGQADGYPVAATAFLLRSGAPAPSRSRIGPPRRAGGAFPGLPADLALHPCAPAFRLERAIGSGLRGPLSLGEGPEGGWCVDLEPAP